MLARDGGDPTPTGLAAGGAVVVVVATGGAAAAADSSDWLAPIIALIAAVFVAVLTAITTNRRQAKQLAAEEERLQRQLDAEDGRLKRQLRAENKRSRRQRDTAEDHLLQQLSHARDLAELAHLRDVFDEAATVFEARRHVVNDYVNTVLGFKRGLEEQEAILPAAQRAFDARVAMTVFFRRLGLRLPVEHEVSDAFAEVDLALDHWEDAIPLDEPLEIDEEQMQELRGLVIVRWRIFVDAARAELDSRA